MINDADKTREQLFAELAALRQQYTELEAKETQHTHVEDALRESDARYRDLFENAGDMVYTFDLKQRLTSINHTAERLLGYTREEAYGMRLADLLTPESLQYSCQMRAQKDAGESQTKYEVEVVTKTRQRVPLEVNTRLICKDGRPIGVQGIGRDITVRKQMQRALQQAHDELEQRVAERTADLQRVNRRLQTEIAERKQAQVALQASEAHQRQLAAEQAVLAEVGRTISASPDINDVYTSFTAAVRKIIPCDRITISLVNFDTRTITNAYVAGREVLDRRAGDTIPLANTLVEMSLRTPGGLLLHPQSEAEVLQKYPGVLPLYRCGLRSFLAVPLTSHDHTIGVLLMQTSLPNHYTHHTLQFAGSVGNQVAGAIANAQLYRERQQAEQALRESEERFRSLIEHSPTAISLKDREGVFRLVNKRFVQWYSKGEEVVLGKTAYDIYPQEYADRYVSHDREVLETGTMSEQKLDVPFADGALHQILETKYPVCDADGRPVGVGTITTDITEHKRLEERLRQAQKMEAIGTLAGGIAHDFNNVLAGIMGYTELTTYDVPPYSASWHNLQEVLTASKRAKELVQQILTFSRQTEIVRKPLSLQPLVKEVLQFLRASLPATITIQESIAPDHDTVLADATQIHQVLMNLCANAEYAMRGRPGTLEVRLETIEVDDAFTARYPELQPGPHMRFTVRDTGCGMGTKIVERVFEPFFTTKQTGEGTGMGLAVVHGIVAEHHGAMTVTSAVGVGTTFAIYLPRIDPVSVDNAPLPTPFPSGQGCLLFVDDEEMLVRLGQVMLQRLGYEVVTKTSSLEALETFRAAPHRFDLVITDQTMPNMTGEVLTRELRCIRPDIPIVLCTGFSHTMSAEKAHAMGIDAFCMKPFGAHEMAMTIQQVLGKRGEPRKVTLIPM